MSTESIVLFLLALLVWGLSVGAKWLQEQMERHTTDGIEMEPIEWPAPPEIEAISEPQMVRSGQPQLPTPSAPDRGSRVRQKKMTKRLGLGNPQTLRQGMILMTVLGPCRALEQPSDSRPF